MGASDEEVEKRSNRRAKQKAARGRRKSASLALDIRAADHAALVAAIIVAAEGAGALRVGLTRDGGALAIGCYAGDDYATEYIKPTEDMETAFREIVEAWWPEQADTWEALVQMLRQGRALTAPE